MAYTKQIWENENPSSQLNETRLNHIEDGVANAYNVSLIAISNTAPSECSTGDKYFNTSTGLIYTATATNTWGSTGETPISDKFYVLVGSKSLYTYNGINLVCAETVGSIPIGGSTDYWGTTDPNANWLIMDGRAISRTEYSELFAIIGTSCGEGNGSTTFNIPKVDGRITVGLDSNDTDFDTIGKTLGSKELQEHAHLLNASSPNTATSFGDGYVAQSNSYSLNTNYKSATAGTGDSGNIQPSIVCNKIIRVK